MYPYTILCSVLGNRTKLRPVVVGSYQEGISHDSFRRRILSGLCTALKEYKTYDVYEFLPIEVDDWSIESDKRFAIKYNTDRQFSIVGDPVPLKDYYKEIGYDYKTKKFHGMTIRQYIKSKMRG